MITEKVMANPCEDFHPIPTENIKALVDLSMKRAEMINNMATNICKFLDAEEFEAHASIDYEKTDVIDFKTQVIRLVEVTENSAELLEIIERSLGM